MLSVYTFLFFETVLVNQPCMLTVRTSVVNLSVEWICLPHAENSVVSETKTTEEGERGYGWGGGYAENNYDDGGTDLFCYYPPRCILSVFLFL